MATAFGMHGVLVFAFKRIATKTTAPSLFSLRCIDGVYLFSKLAWFGVFIVFAVTN
jgi:hypothetical protein